MSGLIRQVEAEGGFATILARGERDAGTMMIVLTYRGAPATAYEFMPQLDGSRKWAVSRHQDTDKIDNFSDYLTRRINQDRDLWIIELDVRNAERFIENLAV